MTFVPPGVTWCADFEFGIRLPFICVEIAIKYPKEKCQFLLFFILTPKNEP